MKILIFTGGFGMGHNSAAEAVKEEILKDDPTANIIIIDLIQYIFPKLGKLIYASFNFMVSKFSSIYNFLIKLQQEGLVCPLKNL